jgi:hypothetical protein
VNGNTLSHHAHRSTHRGIVRRRNIDRAERTIAARRVKLQAYSGRLTDGEPYFLLVGTRLGVFGAENESHRSIDEPQLEQIMRDTATKLEAAGLAGTPQLHLQFEAQY